MAMNWLTNYHKESEMAGIFKEEEEMNLQDH